MATRNQKYFRQMKRIQARYRPLPEIASRTFQEEAVWRDVYALLSEN
jgi:hypothetical protein